MALSDLKAKLNVVKTMIKTSMVTAAAERIEKAKARAAERLAKAEKARDQKYLLDCLTGTKEEKGQRLSEIEQALAEYDEICDLENEADLELLRATNKSAAADRDTNVANAKAVLDEIRAEKTRVETDPDVKFFGWHRQIERQTEKPDRRKAVEEIDRAMNEGLLLEITGERAHEIMATGKKDKETQQPEERHTPFFYIRVKPSGSTPQGEMEPDDHFRYISGGVDFYERTPEGARKRLVFFNLQGLWKAFTEARTAAHEAAKEVKKHSYLTIADIAAGRTGQAWAEVTEANPWRPVVFNRETEKMEPLMKDGREVINFGPIVVEGISTGDPRIGILKVPNIVPSGMYHPLRLVGVWDENGEPLEFKFFAGNNPHSGAPNNFAGLKPVKDTVDLPPAKLGRLRALLCFAGGFKAPDKKEGNVSESPSTPATERGHRSDGTKAGEPRHGKKSGGKTGRRNTGEEIPEVPRGIQSSADLQEE